ncbi:MAG: ribonuclease J [Proteobacteria bacterium]|nr:ribonuclease J [Pseudomonadota bacterium]MBI3498903.1 ribonuclease J [Pseudomonadota bacterium]
MSPRGDDSGTSELRFLPLGGAGEIGMNLNLYGYRGKWLIVDCGITFGDDTTPGIEVIMPDPAWIAERRRDLVGIVATHAHEDHIGAIPYLWPELACPVYATPFTAALLKRKLAEVDLLRRVSLIEIPVEGRFSVGPFDIELIRLTHSIPEPMALAIRTSAGTVLHTGDWKLDPEPLIGKIADEPALRALGEEGVLALVGDSTNVFRPGESGSEAEVRADLMRLVGGYKRRVAVACFASNVARLETLARVAEAHGRHAALVGRSLWRIYDAARETGYLTDIPPFVTEHDAGFLPNDKVLLICTGSQGEPRSALARIAGGGHPHVVLEAGDVAIFSSRIIPGNERAIGRLQNQLSRLGVEIVTERDEAGVHVSGHPNRDELVRMYQWVRPQIAIPVHGEMRHLIEHAKLAGECQVPQSIVVENGAMIRLAPGPAGIVEEVATGRLALDGTRLVPLEGQAVRSRRRLMRNGAAVMTLLLSRDGKLRGDPVVTFQGVIEEAGEAEMSALAADVARDTVAGLSGAARRDDDLVREAVRVALRRCLHDHLGKKPQTDIHLMRV